MVIHVLITSRLGVGPLGAPFENCPAWLLSAPCWCWKICPDCPFISGHNLKGWLLLLKPKMAWGHLKDCLLSYCQTRPPKIFLTSPVLHAAAVRREAGVNQTHSPPPNSGPSDVECSSPWSVPGAFAPLFWAPCQNAGLPRLVIKELIFKHHFYGVLLSWKLTILSCSVIYVFMLWLGLFNI